MPTIATLNTVNALTKELYQGKIREQMQDEVIGLRRIERTSAGVSSEVGGKYVTFPIRVSRNAGIGYREENETLQSPGTQGYARVNVGLKYGYGRVAITGQTMDLAESNPQSFASALDREMQGLKNDLAKDSARIFYGDGTGVLAVCTTAGTTVSTFTAANYQNLQGQIGAVVDIINASAAGVVTETPTAGKEHPKYSETESLLNAPLLAAPSVMAGGPYIITGISSVGVVTLAVAATGAAASLTTTVGDVMVRSGNLYREPYGLAALVGTQKIFNVDPAAVPAWQSTINANGGTGRALSEGLMIKMTDDVRMQGGKTSLILTSLGVRRAYFALLTQQRRYTNTKDFGGGMTGLAFNNGTEIPIVEDVDAPTGKMWFLDESAFKVYRDKDWSWLDTDGGIWKWVSNKDAFEAVLKQYWQIGIDRRNAQGLLSDITEG
jgi:hypothetical protein